ncbi:MAG: hypothetical protein ONB31_02815 [candidate division KSB1 bacterium]|nr:hypothetical protein [candidate division KSB1 bacterium]MDZ7333988.1 hypothetical protein [candidate division KSB1 bacterium]MDZ7357972.1 hypothetical protein [candidate division KSB1 bacterium]MDZ7399973.1 hypothetical protein [candidate division KSB1 bacterium]
MLRIILLGLLIYIALKLLKDFLMSPQQKIEVKGTPTNKKPLDLSDADIEDAKFEDIKDE